MPRAARRVDLPDGTQVWAPNAVEAAVLYHELAEQSVYSRHGIDVADGNCIFDVGANIGLYSVLLARAHRRLRVFAFEPVASVYALLERNLRPHRGDASIELFDCALGRQAGTARGELDLGLSFAATLRAQDVARAIRPGVSALEFATALLADLTRTAQVPARWADLTCCSAGSDRQSRALSTAAVLALALGVRWRAGGGLRRQHFTCQVRTLSDVIRHHDVPTIDVLKIDVEGSEWEVLAGMEPVLWPRVRQVIVEVHDADGRVEHVERLLHAEGFHTWVDQEDWAIHPLLGIYTVYAKRAV